MVTATTSARDTALSGRSVSKRTPPTRLAAALVVLASLMGGALAGPGSVSAKSKYFPQAQNKVYSYKLGDCVSDYMFGNYYARGYAKIRSHSTACKANYITVMGSRSTDLASQSPAKPWVWVQAQNRAFDKFRNSRFAVHSTFWVTRRCVYYARAYSNGVNITTQSSGCPFPKRA